MRLGAAAIFVLGLAFVIGITLAVGRPIVGTEIAIVAAIVGVAGLGMAAMSRFGKTTPATCPSCGGLVSKGDSLCKHCGSAISPQQDAR